MTPDLEHVLRPYIQSGWIDVTQGHSTAGFSSQLRPAYLLLSSGGMLIQPRSEVQVSTRCYHLFRAHKMIVAEDSGRFDLMDLKVNFRSQFSHAQDLPLREHVALVRGRRSEVKPAPIRWPLEVCTYASEVIARAIIPEGLEEDLGVEFEIVLLGEVVG